MIDLVKVAEELVDRLGPGPFAATYVQNPGGYVNVSFTVTGGPDPLHVKLSPELDRFDLQIEHADLLTERYRAPEILDRVELPDSGLTGLVFPHLDGSPPEPPCDPALVADVLEVAARIHADADLASRLDEEATFLSCYETGIHECLSEDLVAVKADPDVVTWISPRDLRFLQEEVERLRRLGLESLSDEPCVTAVHGDLWHRNILVGDGGWHLVDWDGLGIGDPADDYAMFLFYAEVERRRWGDLLPGDPDLRARVELLYRAYAFDAIVDPLADCTEMPDGVPDREAVRDGKRRRSEAALADYRAGYG
jgi:hypothetical protein